MRRLTVDDWLERVRIAKADRNTPRAELMNLIASGPCGRVDVEAAKRLLLKGRYTTEKPPPH